MPNEFDNFDDPDFDDLPEQDEEELAASVGMSVEEYRKVVTDVENFNDSFLSHLAGTAKYEVVPTELDVDQFLEDEHYQLVKKECEKIGAKVLYSYKVGNNQIVINPINLKSVVIQEGEVIKQ